MSLVITKKFLAQTFLVSLIIGFIGAAASFMLAPPIRSGFFVFEFTPALPTSSEIKSVSEAYNKKTSAFIFDNFQFELDSVKDSQFKGFNFLAFRKGGIYFEASSNTKDKLLIDAANEIFKNVKLNHDRNFEKWLNRDTTEVRDLLKASFHHSIRPEEFAKEKDEYLQLLIQIKTARNEIVTNLSKSELNNLKVFAQASNSWSMPSVSQDILHRNIDTIVTLVAWLKIQKKKLLYSKGENQVSNLLVKYRILKFSDLSQTLIAQQWVHANGIALKTVLDRIKKGYAPLPAIHIEKLRSPVRTDYRFQHLFFAAFFLFSLTLCLILRLLKISKTGNKS